MVQDIQRTRPIETTSAQANGQFPASAPAANPVFYRTYSRKLSGTRRESWSEVTRRTLGGLAELGQFTDDEKAIVNQMQQELKCLPSGRWLWVGGTEWIKKPENFNGAYNCTSTNVVDWAAFGLMMDLAMMGCGTGAIIEPKYTNRLPAIRNVLTVKMGWGIGTVPENDRVEKTEVNISGNAVEIIAGDSRRGWVDSYQALLEMSTDERFDGPVTITIDLGNIRPAGEKLKGFGGVANPIKLPNLYDRCAQILNKAIGRQMTPVECCLLIDEAAACVVAGNIRRCLPEDALVHTARGLVAIKDVHIGDRVQTPIGFRAVVNKFDQGVQNVYDIDTNAMPSRATANHRHAVLSNVSAEQTLDQITWKRVGDLAEGDRLMHNTQILPGTVTELPTDFTSDRPAQSHTAKALEIPKLTADVAWLIGFTHGDGYVALGRNKHDKPYGRVEWAMNANTPELTHSLQQKLDRALNEFGITATHGVVAGENTARTVCSSIRLAEYFHHYIKQPRVTLVVPEFILKGSVEVRAGYLAGLMDSDGAVNNRPPHLVTTVYRSFARQIGVVLSSLGIAGRLSIVQPQDESWQVKYNITLPALKGRYNSIVALHSVKGELRQGLKSHGFTIPGAMMREAYTYSEMRDMGFEGARTTDPNYERYCGESDIALDIPVTVRGLSSYDSVQTYDIEVEEAHCFYCDGYLTHNSAGMRQGNSADTKFAMAKDDLWQQADDGNWRIDPERDAFRMANHTRVYHHKPTKQEVLDAVRKQFYSGEGAIQYAPEAIARSSADLFKTRDQQIEFITAYESGKGAEFLLELNPTMEGSEIEHRLGRYGLNPCGEILGEDFHCVSGETFLITKDGLHQIRDVVGRNVEVWNGESWSSVMPMVTGRDRKLYRVQFGDGTFLDVTEGHRFFIADRFSTSYKEFTTAELQSHLQTHPYAVHTESFEIAYHDGEYIDPTWAYTLGQLVGDGSLCKSNGKPQLQLRLYGEKSYRELTLAGRTSGKERFYTANKDLPCLLYTGFHTNFDPEMVRSLKSSASAFDPIASWSRDSILHFVAGLADSDGSAVSSGGIRLYLSDYDRAYRVYLLLLKCGIRSSVNLVQKAGTMTNLGQRKKDLWYLQITDCAAIPCQRLDTQLGHKPTIKGKWQNVRGITELPDRHDTYCFDEPVRHKGVFGGTLTGQCNLAEIHLNQIDPTDLKAQDNAFTAGGLTVAALLNHQFTEPRYQHSRLLDPIVGVSFTGLFDFFVQAFGTEWLNWWEAGRPNTMRGLEFKAKEQEYLSRWKATVHKVVAEYCTKHGIKPPNRCTTVQPAGTKSLLTGASSGWHPPKAQRFIRRITFGKNDPVALACLDYGYSIVPSQSDKDENGNLLTDAFDPRCTEWLVEIPVEVPWANIPGADEVSIELFSATAQFDFYMQVQKYYTAHNTSATIELREDEIDALADVIYDSVATNDGYMSAALLARFDAPFPRLPFEKIDRETYLKLSAEVLERRTVDDFYGALAKYDSGEVITEGPAGCDSDKCLFEAAKK